MSGVLISERVVEVERYVRKCLLQPKGVCCEFPSYSMVAVKTEKNSILIQSQVKIQAF